MIAGIRFTNDVTPPEEGTQRHAGKTGNKESGPVHAEQTWTATQGANPDN